MSKKERILSWILLVLCAAPILAAVVGVQFLPDQIPVHYNDVGEIERWGSKYEELILGVAFSLSGWILWLVSRFSGVFADTETERVQAQANAHIVRIAGIAVQLFLTVLEVVMLIGAAREAATAAVVSSVPLYKIIGIGCGLLFWYWGISCRKQNQTRSWASACRGWRGIRRRGARANGQEGSLLPQRAPYVLCCPFCCKGLYCSGSL